VVLDPDELAAFLAARPFTFGFHRLPFFVGFPAERFDFAGGLFDLGSFALLFFEELVAALGDRFGFLFRGTASEGQRDKEEREKPTALGPSASPSNLPRVTKPIGKRSARPSGAPCTQEHRA
jgi:hypothetical protein